MLSLEGGLNTYGYASGNPILRIDPNGLLDWSDVSNFGRGFGSYFRGLYRGGVQVARRAGAFGSCDRDSALSEDALLAQALQQLKDPAIRALALKESAEWAANNKSFLSGRATAGFITGTGLSGGTPVGIPLGVGLATFAGMGDVTTNAQAGVANPGAVLQGILGGSGGGKP
jgi:hypothetical protein